VGSDQAGTHIYRRATHHGKRVQSNMGAKNHGVILPDANKTATLNALVGAGTGGLPPPPSQSAMLACADRCASVGAAFGAAGQRCMALSTVVLVGEAQSWAKDLVGLAKQLKVNAGKQLGGGRCIPL
jgi:malonate-semialdehyde dehydrogenase (acetylating)/methylmalonate-semialdehyde dehydrogenase